MAQNYFKTQKYSVQPRPIVIQRILAFSKYYDKSKPVRRNTEKID
jgi:hypothetical protein